MYKITWKNTGTWIAVSGEDIGNNLVNWCFEPSQPLGIISGQKTNSNSSLSNSAHKSFKTTHIFFLQHS